MQRFIFIYILAIAIKVIGNCRVSFWQLPEIFLAIACASQEKGSCTIRYSFLQHKN